MIYVPLQTCLYSVEVPPKTILHYQLLPFYPTSNSLCLEHVTRVYPSDNGPDHDYFIEVCDREYTSFENTTSA